MSDYPTCPKCGKELNLVPLSENYNIRTVCGDCKCIIEFTKNASGDYVPSSVVQPLPTCEQIEKLFSDTFGVNLSVRPLRQIATIKTPPMFIELPDTVDETKEALNMADSEKEINILLDHLNELKVQK